MRKILLALMFLFAASSASLAQTTLFGGVGRGSDAHRGIVITIDQTNAAGTLVGAGATDPAVGLTGLAFATSGQLFASTISAPLFGGLPVSTLIQIDPFTGLQVDLIGTIQLATGTPVVISDLALQPGTGVLFGTAIDLATGTNNIYTIDETTAVATFVGNTGVTGATLAFGPDGTLYQTSATFTETGVFLEGFLNTLDPDSAEVLTTSDPFTVHIGGLTVHPNGVIFASGGMESDIYILSAEGELTFLGKTGFGGVGDIAFTPGPTDKDQCKKGGWNTNFPFANFKNQGDCIQFVNTGK